MMCLANLKNSFLLSIMFSVTSTVWAAANYELASDQVAHIGNGAEPRELDPAKSTGVPESHILDNLFEGLAGLEPFTLEPVPGVAEKWEISKDGLTYTFYLRKDAKWSDGKALTAEDFVWSWARTLSPELASEYAYQLFYVKNAESYNAGKLKDAKQLGVKAKDAHTLVVTLEKPTPFFLRLVAFHTLYPVPRHVIEKHKGVEWTRAGTLVSNGAFKLEEWKLNQHIKLVPNPHYWNKGLVTLKAAYIYPIENIDTEERTFFSGKLHKTNEVPNLKIPIYLKQKVASKGQYHPYRSDPYLGVYFYRLNVAKPPLNDVRVRKALALAIDRKQIVEKITQGGQQPALTYTPPGVGGYTAPGVLPPSLTPEKLAEAKELLKQAGYPDGKGFPKVEILYNTSENHRKIAMAVQQMWKKNLGVEIGLYNQEWKVYLDTQDKKNYQICRAAWIGDYADPNTFLDMWVTDGGQNHTNWSNKQYDQFIEEASKTADNKVRYEAFLKAENILMQELPIIPVYIYTLPRLVSEKLKMVTNDGTKADYKPNIQDRLFLKNLAIAK